MPSICQAFPRSHIEYSFTANYTLVLFPIIFQQGILYRLFIHTFRSLQHQNSMNQKKTEIKIVLVGDPGVGKSCILHKYAHNKDVQRQQIIFESFPAQKQVDKQSVSLSLWDTAGQEYYKRPRSIAYHDCDIFLIVFSVANPQSFNNAYKKWYPELHQLVTKPSVMFVGNQIDLRKMSLLTKLDPEENITTKTATAKIQGGSFNCKYMECSAKNEMCGKGVTNVFNEAIRAVLRKRIKPIDKKIEEEDSFCNLI